MPDMWQAARCYVKEELNWWVLPLHRPVGTDCSCDRLNCSSPGKHPKPRHGHKDATNNLARIDRYGQRWQQANLGIAVEPSGIVIIDIDPRHGGRVGSLPLHPDDYETPIANTGGGGLHLVFRAPISIKVSNSSRRLPPGIDVKAKGYIVVPPSLHVSGKQYEWQPGKAPWEIKPLPLTADLMTMLVKRGETVTTQSPISPMQPDTDTSYSTEAIIERELNLLAQTSEGGRNNALNRAAFLLGIEVAKGNLSSPEVEQMLTHTALSIGLGEAETRRTIRSGLTAGLSAVRVESHRAHSR